MSLRIGLTGGIASGKTTVCKLFAEYCVPIIDADILAREVVAPGQPALHEIVLAFGTDYINAEGQLDRGKLRSLVFADPEKRRRLEAILHPRIQSEMLARAQASRAPYCILAIPLLLEVNQTHLVQRILVVDVPVAIQLKRVMERDGLSESEALAIIHTQISREARLKAADDVIHNDGDLVQLAGKVKALHEQYLQLSTQYDQVHRPSLSAMPETG